MPIILTDADERKLVGVNYRLVAVVRRVAAESPRRFLVAEGLRTKQRQRELFAQGKTKTLNSKHIIGRAVDCYPTDGKKIAVLRDEFTWLVELARRVSSEMGTPLVFGHDWGWDSPHWELKEP